ncbi:MAG: hypothetical protein LBT09_02050 [Planctomycetaceae bacterium]|jgi:hypothetical protein|nr:hypothetical protein [Planctomycetaceae bacterium]
MNIFCNNKYFLIPFVILLAAIFLRFNAEGLTFGQNGLFSANNNSQNLSTLQPTSTSTSTPNGTTPNYTTPKSALLFDSSSLLNLPPVLSFTANQTPPPQTESNDSLTSKQEPYRVFFPTGQDGKIVNNIVWLPEEFFRLLHKSTSEIPQSTSKNWHIESSEYVGKLIFNSLTKTFDAAEFKAIYQIGVESENVTITLPALPLAQADATWDSIPVRAAWQIKKNDTPAAKNNNRILTFEIENTTRGKHKLEIPLEPQIIHNTDNTRINFDIPKVPNTRLKLITPPNSPTISVNESLGEVSINQIKTTNKEHELNNNQLIADIGQVTKLALMWNNDLYRNELSDVETDTFIRMQARTSQVDVRAKFNYKVTGNKIRYVNVLLDHHWQISGQFLCDEYQIDRVETVNELVKLADGVVSRREVARVIFKSPVSGSFTLRAGFVLHDFSGVGCVRMPELKPYRAKINKMLLAVFSDPLLEIDFPQQGKNKSISCDWTTTPLIAANDNTAIQERFIAEYDLKQTDADWKLAIQTKPITPKVALIQSTLLDTGDSTLQCNGEFECEGETFGQNFTLPETVAIESIEVRDSQRNLVATRWGKTQNAKKINGETRVERKIFFRKPLSGKYRIIITGHFVTKNISRTPLLEFDGVELLKHQFELYRTSALIVHGDVIRTVWRNEKAQRNLFANAKFIGLWNSADAKNPANIISPRVEISLNRPVIQGEITTILHPLSASQTTPNSTSASAQPTAKPASDATAKNISVTINHDTQTPPPTSTTTPVTVPAISENSWGVIFDVNWNINAGELEQIRLLLDENIALITSIEPAVKWSIEQHRTSGQAQLVFTPINTAKQQHYKINAKLNGQNRTISLPKLTPEWNNGEQAEIKNYAILPVEIENDNNKIAESKIIGSKNTNEEIDGDKIDVVQPKLISWNLSNLQKVDETLQNRLSLLTSQNMKFIYLAATNNNYSASIIRGGSRPFVTLYDVNFHVGGNGELFGAATLDLKNTGDNKFVVVLPEGYELIKISMTGGAVGSGSVSGGGVKLDRNRWQLEICDSDYPIRIGLIFRAVFDSIPMTLQFPMLENVEVNETLWTISYGENVEIAKRNFDVVVTGAELENVVNADAKLESNTVNNSGNGIIVTEMLGRQIPAAGETAAAMLLKFDLVRLDNLLFIASGVPTPAAGKNVEIRHWFAQWEQEWSGINRTINYLKTAYPTILNDADNKINTVPVSDKISGQRSISSLIGLMDSPEKSLQALRIRKSRESQRLGIIVTENNVLPSLIESNPVVLCRVAMTRSGTSLFGAVKGSVREVSLTPVSETIRMTNGFDIFVCVIAIMFVIAATILILWKYKKINPKEIFLRYQLFWFFVLGCAMIIFFPDGIVGTAIVVTILLTKLKNKKKKEKAHNRKNIT